jgi:voltage-gated potassium channel
VKTTELGALRARLLVPIGLLLVTHLFGTLALWTLWRERGATLFDALFMTFITVTTIGYGEVHPLGTAGRMVVMVIAAGGIGTLFFTFSAVMEFVSSDEVRALRRRRRMQKSIDELQNHVVLAGFGRVGREAALELIQAKASVVVVDPDPEVAAAAEERGFYFVRGDATDDETLNFAGITRARGLIVTTANDATNLYVILSARLLSPTVFIATRAIDNHSVPKLMRAGANRAISPYAIGGRRLAHLLLSPRVVDFLETAMHRGNKQLNIGEIVVPKSGSVAGRPLEQLRLPQVTGTTVLAVLRTDNEVASPRGDLVLVGGDHLLVLGTDEQLEKLENLMSPVS